MYKTMLSQFNLKIVPHKRAKRMKLRYDASNECAVVTIPEYGNENEARLFAEKHLDWLIKQKRRSPERTLLMPGYVIPFKGDDHIIRHLPDHPAGIEISDYEILVGGTIEGLPKRIENYFKKLVRREIEAIAEEMALKTGKQFSRIQIRDTKSRWGSCSTTGTLSFSWRLIMAPCEILEYVVAHEVAHLSEMNHSSDFWHIVDQLVEDADRSRRWLKTEGQNLMLVLSENH